MGLERPTGGTRGPKPWNPLRARWKVGEKCVTVSETIQYRQIVAATFWLCWQWDCGQSAKRKYSRRRSLREQTSGVHVSLLLSSVPGRLLGKVDGTAVGVDAAGLRGLVAMRAFAPGETVLRIPLALVTGQLGQKRLGAPKS